MKTNIFVVVKHEVFFPQSKARLRTRSTNLRWWDEEDVDPLFELRSDPETMRYIGVEPMTERKEAEKYIQKYKDRFDQREAVTWCIADKKTDKMLGYVTIFQIDHGHHFAKVGYALLRKHVSKGIMSEVLPAVIRYAFDEMNLHRLEANIDSRNIASEKLLIKCGFTKEAHFKENYHFRGEYLDSFIYALVNPNR